MEKNKTVVVFRKYKDGQVIALFPNEVADPHNNCLSYMHVGQHGAADYNGVMKDTKAATQEEYQSLFNELTTGTEPYDLKVMKRHRVGKVKEEVMVG